jgi:aminoglycoside 6'-N-acetyltransferase I
MVRQLKQADTAKLKSLLGKITIFTKKEVEVAMELINIAALNPEQTDYNIYVLEEDDKILGYHCTGQRALTDGVYDLYWIAADPDAERKGIGKELLNHAEEFVTGRKGRWILAETSSREVYSGTRNFYMRNKYSIIASIKDFYAVGDDLVIFGKYFSY